jgi:hypothetical protein
MHLSNRAAVVVWKVAIVALGALGATGCGGGPDRLGVAGQVTLDGQPLADGEIVFRPTAATQGPSVAGSIENGAYDIPDERGPVAGSYAVTITAERKTGRKIKADILGNATTDQYEQYLPARYNDKTELSAEIAESRDDLDFELTSKK